VPATIRNSHVTAEDVGTSMQALGGWQIEASRRFGVHNSNV
jgi:hypothetical protein